MKLHFMGKYNGSADSLPSKPHREGAIAFKEPADMKALAIKGNVIALILTVIFFIPLFIFYPIEEYFLQIIIGALLSLIILYPHEILHAVCFKEDAYIYSNLKQGLMFVFGAEDMTKSRFVFMSLLPNVVFGLIPYTLGLIFPRLAFLAFFGALSLGAGAGDYMNIFNALTQVPKDALIYMYGINTFWYKPHLVKNSAAHLSSKR